MSIRVLFLLVTLLACAGEDTVAGKLFARRPGTASPVYNLRATNIDVHISVRHLFAVTEVDEEFHNDSGFDLEGFYVFQLPEHATVDGLWLWIDGKRYTFIVRRKEAAQAIYDSLKGNNLGDPAILESFGSNRFQLRIHPIRSGQSRRIELRYFQPLPMNESGTARLYYPLNLAGYQQVEVEHVTVQADIEMPHPFASVETNFDDRPLMLSRTEFSDRHVRIDFEAEGLVCAEDLELRFSMDGWHAGFPKLTYSEPGGEAESYAMIWHPVQLDPGQQVKGDFVFVLDASASMTGARIPLLLDALERVLGRLQEYDRFRIVLFSGSAMSIPSDTSFVFANANTVRLAMIETALAYRARGTTSYEAGLRMAMWSNFREDADTRIVLFTDGLPNAGRRSESDLADMLQLPGRGMVRLFPVTLYTEKLDLLSDVAQRSGGRLIALEQGDDLASALERLTFDFSSMVLADIDLFYPATTWLQLPGLHRPHSGSGDLLVATRYQPSPTESFGMRYHFSGSTAVRDKRLDLALAADTTGLVQVARYWASLRIRALLEELRDVEDSTEIIESVVRLSEKHMILSPFTAFVVWKHEDDPLAVGDLSAPGDFTLEQNYPNPFTTGTHIRFTVPGVRDRMLSVIIYDSRGRAVRTLVLGTLAPGRHVLQWDGRDDDGRPLPSGAYLCRLTAGSSSAFILMILQK